MFNLHIVRGKDKKFALVVRDSNDALIDLTGKTLVFSAKLKYEDADPPLVLKQSGSGITHAINQTTTGKGLATLELLPADTDVSSLSKVAASQLYAELEIEQVTDQPETLDTGYLQVNPAVKQTL